MFRLDRTSQQVVEMCRTPLFLFSWLSVDCNHGKWQIRRSPELIYVVVVDVKLPTWEWVAVHSRQYSYRYYIYVSWKLACFYWFVGCRWTQLEYRSWCHSATRKYYVTAIGMYDKLYNSVYSYKAIFGLKNLEIWKWSSLYRWEYCNDLYQTKKLSKELNNKEFCKFCTNLAKSYQTW